MKRWYLHNLHTGRVMLIEGSLTVGRRMASLSDDTWLSREHFRIEVKGSDEVWLTDLGSNNGTSVNGARVEASESRKLAPADQIQAGNQFFKIWPAPVLPGSAGLGEAVLDTLKPSSNAVGAFTFMLMGAGALLVIWLLLDRIEIPLPF